MMMMRAADEGQKKNKNKKKEQEREKKKKRPQRVLPETGRKIDFFLKIKFS